MLLSQITALIGIALSFLGSVYLAVRVFQGMVSLQDVFDQDINQQLKNISESYASTSDTKATIEDLIGLLNIAFVDFESSKMDTAARAKKGMALLILGSLLHAVALGLALNLF